MKKLALVAGISAALMSGIASAHEAGSTILRAGGALVIANSHSSTKTATEIGLEVNNNAQLGLTGTYMFTDNVGVELLAATPFSHKIDAHIPALGANLGTVAKVKHLPPSLYVQYYFLNKDSGSRPYVGVGLNYTRFFGAKSLNPAITNLQVKKHSFGPVVNAGIDIKLTDNLYFNTALWYTHIKTKAKFDALNASHEVNIKLDPIVFFTGLAYRF
ncbi:MAG: OmpW family outer membrane protein [Pasteurellaceae bacterium]|nr:OmpW family outer membrane protein [Pasteurellaceae bacterium]